MTAAEFQRSFRKLIDRDKAAFAQTFFKAYEGGYGGNDKFLGVRVPIVRDAIRPFRAMPLDEVVTLLKSEWHEERLAALLLWVHQMARADEATQRAIYNSYLAHTKHINNWDLVDASTAGVAGVWLRERSRAPLWKLAKSKDLWERRIAIIATLHFIKHSDLDETFALAETLLGDKEDLMHKAVGWALREAGKKDHGALVAFLRKHYKAMPRTALRYSIERFPEKERRAIIEGSW